MSNVSLKPKALTVLAFCCFFGLISCGKKKEKPAKAAPTVTVASCQKDKKILAKDGQTCVASCPQGQVNRGDQCVQPEKVACAADEVKVEENLCEKVSAASCQKVSKNLSRDGKSCVYKCADDEKVMSGQCIKKDSTQQPPPPPPPPCPEGQERGSDGQCRPKEPGPGPGPGPEPEPEPCPEGEERGQDGQCKPKEPGPGPEPEPEEPCPEGQERGEDGQCKPKDPGTGTGLDQLIQKRQSAYSQIQGQGFNPVAGGTIKTESIPGAVVVRELVINFKPGEIGAETEARFAKRIVKIERDRTQGWAFISLHYSTSAVKATDLKLWAACLNADCSEIGFKGKALKKDGKEFVFKAKKQGDAYVVDPSGN